MVFCYQNYSDLLWEKIVLVIKNFFWDHLNNLFKQWKVRINKFQKYFRLDLKVLNFSNFTIWNFRVQLWPRIFLKLVIKIKKSPWLPGVGRTRPGHYHGSVTPTSSWAIFVLKSARSANMSVPSVCSKTQFFLNLRLKSQFQMLPPLHNGRMPWMMLGQIWASWSTLALKCWKPPKNSTSTSMTAKMSLDVSWRRRTQCRRSLDAIPDLFRHFCENIKTSCKIFKVRHFFWKISSNCSRSNFWKKLF